MSQIPYDILETIVRQNAAMIKQIAQLTERVEVLTMPKESYYMKGFTIYRKSDNSEVVAQLDFRRAKIILKELNKNLSLY